MNDTHHSETREYPFDTDELTKGSIVPPDVIESAYGVKRGTDRYAFATLRASEYVERRFADRGQVVTVVIRKDALHILTDEEAVGHNRASFRAGARKMRRANMRQAGSDRALMSEATRAEHDRDLEVSGRVLGAMSKELGRRVIAQPVKRNTPLPPGAEGHDLGGEG